MGEIVSSQGKTLAIFVVFWFVLRDIFAFFWGIVNKTIFATIATFVGFAIFTFSLGNWDAEKHVICIAFGHWDVENLRGFGPLGCRKQFYLRGFGPHAPTRSTLAAVGGLYYMIT